MNAPVVTLGTMQEDHLVWRAAYAQWREEIARWQAEHGLAVARLAEIQQAIRAHGEALQDYARAFQQAEEAITAHDREIAEYRAGNSDVPQDLLATRHQQQETAFRRQQEAHDRIRKHHEAVLAQLKSLESSVAAGL